MFAFSKWRLVNENFSVEIFCDSVCIYSHSQFSTGDSTRQLSLSPSPAIYPSTATPKDTRPRFTDESLDGGSVDGGVGNNDGIEGDGEDEWSVPTSRKRTGRGGGNPGGKNAVYKNAV